MSAYRDMYKARYYVVHKYPRHRHGRLQKCERCGVKRRYRGSNWEYLASQERWTSMNPPCAPKKVKES
jgi:transposase